MKWWHYLIITGIIEIASLGYNVLQRARRIKTLNNIINEAVRILWESPNPNDDRAIELFSLFQPVAKSVHELWDSRKKIGEALGVLENGTFRTILEDHWEENEIRPARVKQGMKLIHTHKLCAEDGMPSIKDVITAAAMKAPQAFACQHGMVVLDPTSIYYPTNVIAAVSLAEMVHAGVLDGWKATAEEYNVNVYCFTWDQLLALDAE